VSNKLAGEFAFFVVEEEDGCTKSTTTFLRYHAIYSIKSKILPKILPKTPLQLNWCCESPLRMAC